MQFAIGFLTALCLTLAVTLVMVWKKVDTKLNAIAYDHDQTLREFGVMYSKFADLAKKVGTPIQNVIHLGMKDCQIATELQTSKVLIQPEQFQINSDKLFAALCHQLETTKSFDLGVRAYVVLKNVGLEAVLNNESRREADKALTRFLMNEDEDGARAFLRILADSAATATAPTIPAITE